MEIISLLKTILNADSKSFFNKILNPCSNSSVYSLFFPNPVRTVSKMDFAFLFSGFLSDSFKYFSKISKASLYLSLYL